MLIDAQSDMESAFYYVDMQAKTLKCSQLSSFHFTAIKHSLNKLDISAIVLWPSSLFL